MIILSIILFLSVSTSSTYSVNKSAYYYIQFTAIFIQQPKSRRAVINMQILTCKLLMLTLIRAITYHFDSPKSKTNNSFDSYYGSQFSRGAAALALIQAF